MNNKKLLACSIFVAAASTAYASVVDYASLQGFFGEPVTLSATGKPQRTSDASAPMEIIDAKIIRRSGAEDITDVLCRATPVDVKKNFKGKAGVPHQVFAEYNLGDIESVGLEFYMDSKPIDNFDYGINYTVNYFTEESDSCTVALKSMDAASQKNRHPATLWGQYTMDKLELDTVLRYASKTIYRSTPEVEIDGYFVLNKRVGYNLTDATSVALKGMNLLEEHNVRPLAA